jgi:hypothetical protein
LTTVRQVLVRGYFEACTTALQRMKILKGILLSILILTAIGIVFRGWFYRHLITYKSVGQRTNYIATDDKLIDYIEKSAGDKKDLDAKDVIKLGLSITSHQLNFTASKNDNDPNKLIKSKTAHCVGYASFFATSCNYLLRKYNLSDSWTAKPQVGQLYFMGTNINKYFSSPFFKDHDFVIIENKKAKEIYAVDPTVNDYLLIDFVTFQQ